MTDIILIVEDHDSVRESLIQWLNGIFPEFEIMGIKTGKSHKHYKKCNAKDSIYGYKFTRYKRDRNHKNY